MTIFDRVVHQWRDRGDLGEPIGFAVVLCTSRTHRAAYMTGEGVAITNCEVDAFVGSRQQAAEVMVRLYDSGWRSLWKIAMLVPVFLVGDAFDNGFPTVDGY